MREIAIAVFASGTGSNFRRLLAVEQAGGLGSGRIRLLVCDRSEAPVIAAARAAGVPVFAARHKELGGKDSWETQALARMRAAGVELVVLAGYMRLVGSVLLSAYRGRMINLHPSLLPAFKGKDAIGQAYAAGVNHTGVSVHYVSEELDGGEVIAQARVDVLPGESIAALEARIHAQEHELLPQVVRVLCEQWAKE